MEQLVPLGHAVGTGWSTPCRWGIMSATWFVCVYKRHLKKMEPRRQRRQSSIVKLETRPLTSFTSRVDQLQRRKSVPLGSSGQADPEKKVLKKDTCLRILCQCVVQFRDHQKLRDPSVMSQPKEKSLPKRFSQSASGRDHWQRMKRS